MNIKTLSAFIAASVVCLVCIAAPPTVITNYFPGAVVTSTTFSDAGDTGLAISNSYVCLPVSILATTELTAAIITNDVRPMVSAVVERMKTAIDAQASSNQFDQYTVDKTITFGSTGTNRTVYRAISEYQVITVTPSYPTE